VKQRALALSDGLARLIRANAPYWGGEAELIRSYWNSPTRNRSTDAKWLTHQMYKEYCDGVLPSLEAFHACLPQTGSHEGRVQLEGAAEVLFQETQHFTLFADLYRALDGVEFALSPEGLQAHGSWPENDDLMSLRRSHLAESVELGARACRFTEGGYCALFGEGMKLAGRGGFDAALADVCGRIYADEFNHMLLGIVAADDTALTESDWDTLVRYTVAQMKLRIHMRDAQFSHPLAADRLAELVAGEAAPAEFDVDRAARLLHERTVHESTERPRG
jgi:hypothetical protein